MVAHHKWGVARWGRGCRRSALLGAQTGSDVSTADHAAMMHTFWHPRQIAMVFVADGVCGGLHGASKGAGPGLFAESGTQVTAHLVAFKGVGTGARFVLAERARRG